MKELETIIARWKAREFPYSVADFIQIEILGLCGCGRPEDNLRYVMSGLNHIKNKPQYVKQPTDYDKWVKKGRKIFGNEHSRIFFFYWAHSMGLTEHGTAIPGWLTDDGRELLAALTQLNTI